MDITKEQLGAGLKLARLTQADIVEMTTLSVMTVSKAFNIDEPAQVKAPTLQEIVGAIQKKGIEFLPHEGVRKRPTTQISEYKGTDGFRHFMDAVYYEALAGCTDFRLQNARPSNWNKHLGDDWYDMHAQRMKAEADKRAPDNKINFMITCCEGDYNHIASSFAEYRWVNKEHYKDQSIYLYGDNVAFLSFVGDVKIVCIKSAEVAASLRDTFDIFWEHNTFAPKAAR